jgi:hypothetical protein
LLIGIGLIISAILIPLFFQSQPTKPTKRPEKITTIRLRKKGQEITINRFGQVTIRTKDKLIMQYWSKDRIEEIFAKIDQLKETSFTYQGESITIDLDDLVQAEELARLGIFTDEETEEIIELLASAAAAPTPTILVRFSSPTPIATSPPTDSPKYPTLPGSTSGPTATQKPFRCIFEEPEEGEESFIISETVCTELID